MLTFLRAEFPQSDDGGPDIVPSERQWLALKIDPLDNHLASLIGLPEMPANSLQVTKSTFTLEPPARSLPPRAGLTAFSH
jgi:hypothetical protein